MALSFCSNWESLQHLNSEMQSCGSDGVGGGGSGGSFQQPPRVPQLVEDCFTFNNINGLDIPETLINPFLQPAEDLFYSNLLPYFSSPSESLTSLSPEIFLLEDFDSYQLPKRQKSYSPHDNFLYGYLPNPPLAPEFCPEVVLAPPADFQVPPPVTFSSGKIENGKKQNGTSLSVQSIAARERRRKITEKTQELGKLIPGGHRMNTAEMFQAASKYVKFLQAQVKILQHMGSKQEGKEQADHREGLQALLASPIIQEKLYSEEKCLIPKEFAETLANDPEIQSKSVIVEGIHQLLRK